MASTMEKGYQQDPPPAYSPNPGPPSYTQAIHDPTEGPPPSYESLYGKVRAAKESSSGFADFMKKFIILLLGTLGCTICIGLLMAVPVAMIVIGALHLHDCPVQHYIPIYLIVAGCFGIVKNLFSLCQRCTRSQEEEEENKMKSNPIDMLLDCFMLAWFIAGNVWIYSIWRQFNETDPLDARYCNPLLYYFAFWVTTACYILMGLTCCCVCFGGVLASCMSAKP